MPADLWFTLEFIGIVVAVAILVYGIAKFDVRPIVAAGMLAGTAWMVAAWSNSLEGPYERLTLLTLRVRIIDARTGKPIHGATVNVVGEDASGSPKSYPVPTAVDRVADGPNSELVRLSLIAEQRIGGSLVDRCCRPETDVELVDQRLEIVAAGYRPWRGSLMELLPEGWPSTAEEHAVVVEMERR
jgi:hypothetical protein